MSDKPTTDATYLGDEVYATLEHHHIVLDTRYGSHDSISLKPAVFIELMRFVRLHMGDEAFREVVRMAGGDCR